MQHISARAHLTLFFPASSQVFLILCSPSHSSCRKRPARTWPNDTLSFLHILWESVEYHILQSMQVDELFKLKGIRVD
ncbi:hypothetical protein F5X98DRAFT_350479 [Xylaria grammica]|nr:hypothetical protein F5X98DRAFT_350479 [Xylaria grammica]